MRTGTHVPGNGQFIEYLIWGDSTAETQPDVAVHGTFSDALPVPHRWSWIHVSQYYGTTLLKAAAESTMKAFFSDVKSSKSLR